MKKALLIFLAAVLLLLSVSCQNTSGDDREMTAPTDDENQAPTGDLLLAKLSAYTFVYPQKGFGSESMSALRDLRTLFRTKFGVTLDMVDDLLTKGQTAKDTEILVGFTNRDASAEVAQGIKKVDEYAVSAVGERLVIVGGSDEATAEAIKYLIGKISALSAEDAYFFKASMAHTQKSEYPIDKIMIGERELSDYTIVYKNSDKMCKELAEQLHTAILEKAGYSLQTMVDTKAKSASSVDRKLILGETLFGLPDSYQEKDGYFVGEKQGDVYLYSSYLPTQMRAVEWITAPLEAAKKGETVKLDPTLGTVSVVDTSIKVMSFNVMVQSATVSTRAPHVIETIKRNDPDVLGVQEASDAWVTKLEAGLSDEYARVGWGRNSNKKGETTSIFYKKDKFTLIEWGTKWMSDTPDTPGSKYEDSAYIRIFTYALLERKSDGARFMHINVHPEDGASAVKKAVRAKQFKVLANWINQNADVPFIVTGDMNSRPEFDEFVQLQKDIHTEKTSDTAYVANKADTYSTGSSSMVLDYILLSKDDFNTFYYDVDTQKVNGSVSNPSDHCPVIVVCDLKKK